MTDHITTLENIKGNGFDMGLENEDYAALDAAITALQAQHDAIVAEVVGTGDVLATVRTQDAPALRRLELLQGCRVLVIPEVTP